MSSGAEPRDSLPPEWAGLEKAAEDAAQALRGRHRIGEEAQEEIQRLRSVIDQLTAERGRIDELASEVQNLRNQNGALQRRIITARKKISGLMQKLSALDLER